MAEKYCNLNGELKKRTKARVSPCDRAFLYGDGIFDTMSAPKGVPFLFDEHMQRLFNNLKQMEISIPFTKDELYKMITTLIKKNGFSDTDSRVRITVTRGEHTGEMFYPSTSPTLFIKVDAVPDNLNAIRKNGISCIISEVPKLSKNPLYKIKSTNYLWSILGIKEASLAGARDCLYFNNNGYLAEGTTSNVFIVKDKAIFTPPDDAGILPGITRSYLIGLLHNEGIEATKRNITKEELLDADEVFLTSSVRGVVPVSDIGGKSFKISYIRDIQNIYFKSIYGKDFNILD